MHDTDTWHIMIRFTYIITSNNAVVASKRTMMLRQSTATTHCNNRGVNRF